MNPRSTLISVNPERADEIASDLDAAAHLLEFLISENGRRSAVRSAAPFRFVRAIRAKRRFYFPFPSAPDA
jgi:hypothetical protein